MTAVTALTAQNTRGVAGIVPIDPAFVAMQMRVVLDDLGADAVKTGMLGDAAVIGVVADLLAAQAATLPLVVDPVMVAKGGASLLAASAVACLVARLLPLATLLTPNLPEASALLGYDVADVATMVRAGRDLCARGAVAVLVKGGHLPGDALTDVLVTAAGEVTCFAGTRLATRHTHGTGCTLASAIATGLGAGLDLKTAVSKARDYLRRAIEQAPGFGQGHGPLDHGHPLMAMSGDQPIGRF